MARINENMPEKDVLGILGKPDDIRTQFDPGGISRVGTKEIWCYGTEGHLAFPTLGCVYLDTNGRSQEVFGGKGRPPKTEWFTEQELRNLLRLFNTAPGLEGNSYNPLPVIRIVNALQPLGKEKALAAISEYLRVSDEWSGFCGPRTGIFLVLRVLFDLPDNVDPREAGAFGGPNPPNARDPHLLPRFPIAMVDDIPMMLVSGYLLAGRATPMEDVVDFYRVHGRIRSKQLVPSNAPLAALEHLANSSQWPYADPNLVDGGILSWDAREKEGEDGMLMEQLLRLVDSVYRLPVDLSGNRLPCGEPPEPTWRKLVAAVSGLDIRWDTQQSIFVFPDGTHHPFPGKNIYRREIWDLTGMGYDNAQLVLERINDAWVLFRVNSTQSTGAELKAATLSVFDADEQRAPLFTFTFTNKVGVREGRYKAQIIEVAAGTQLRAKLVIDGNATNSSPNLKP